MLSIILNALDEMTDAENTDTQKVTGKVTIKVTENQYKILDIIRHDPTATQSDIAESIGISRKSVIENMKKLKDNGMIRRVGSSKKGYWQLEENPNG